MSCGSLSPSAAAAVLASRAETPIRIAPVTSFSSAQRPVSSSSSSQRVELRRQFGLAERASVVTTSVRVGGGGLLWRWRELRRRPHQRDRLREIADIVIGQREQHGIGARRDQVADQAGLGVLERQRAGQRRQRIAAIGIGRPRGNSPSSAAACCCGRAHRRGDRAVRRSGSCLGVLARRQRLVLVLVAIADQRERPRRQAPASCTNAPARLPGRG